MSAEDRKKFRVDKVTALTAARDKLLAAIDKLKGNATDDTSKLPKKTLAKVQELQRELAEIDAEIASVSASASAIGLIKFYIHFIVNRIASVRVCSGIAVFPDRFLVCAGSGSMYYRETLICRCAVGDVMTAASAIATTLAVCERTSNCNRAEKQRSRAATNS